MKSSKIFRASTAGTLLAPALVPALVIVTGLLGVCAAPARAQSVGPSISVSTIHKYKTLWLKADIIHADARSMMVRDHDNPLHIYTFTYADEIQGSMEHISEAGGYQYGDRVKIQYFQGQQVALKVRGKPSKPL
jgi:hypothetical protein